MGVTIIKDCDFLSEISLNKRIVIKFFTDWCGSCRLIRPKYIRISDDQRFSDIRFLDMNAEYNPVARKMASVTHFPSFSIFRDGKLIETLATTKENLVIALIERLSQNDE